jgi:CheY-like chemotaxis protein
MVMAGRNASAPRILVVEDNPGIREAVTDILREAGYETEEAENGLDAMQKLKAAARLPALILLDLMMPVMSGGEFVFKLSKEPALRLLPIVVLSAHLDSYAGRDAFECIEKPFSAARLLEIVATYCA